MCGAVGVRDEEEGDIFERYFRLEMLKFGSKNDVTVVHRATIRLLDDTEIIQCDFQVSYISTPQTVHFLSFFHPNISHIFINMFHRI